MSLKPKTAYLLLLFAIFCSLSLQEDVQKSYYIDPTNPASSQSGEFSDPFYTLSAAFNQARQDVALIDIENSFNITFYIKEGTVISKLTDSPSLFLDDNERPASNVLITTYSSVNKPGAATIVFGDAAAHLSFVLRKTKLTIQGFQFQFSLPNGISNTELILMDGESNQLVISNCDFRDAKINLQNKNIPVFSLKHGQYLIKKSSFVNLDLYNPLFQVQEAPKGSIKMEKNTFSQISTHLAPLVAANSIGSFTFVDNSVEKTTGKFVDTTAARNVIMKNNNFFDVVGEFPINIHTAQNVIVDTNTLNYEANEDGVHQGFFSLLNFDVLSIREINLKGYSGKAPALYVSLEETYNTKGGSMVELIDSNFKKNTIVFDDPMKQSGLALFHLDFQQKLNLLIDNTTFSENVALDRQYDPVERMATSTVWIQAEASILKIKNCTFVSNQANRALANLHVDTEDILVTETDFIRNTQINTSNPILNNEGEFRGMVWNGQEIVFHDSYFIENYGDMGGAISIIEADSAVIPHTVIIDSCLFMRNHAKMGGAIYTDFTESDTLHVIQLKNNEFKDNYADQFNDYNPSPIFSSKEKFKIYLERVEKGQKKLYGSGELVLQNVSPGQAIFEELEFYLSDRKKVKGSVSGQYFASLELVQPEKPLEDYYLVENFTRKESGASYKISSLTIVAPFGSQDTIKFTMQNKNDPTEVYSFLIKTVMVKAPVHNIECNPGEFYDHETQICKKCPKGTFSVEANSQCIKCPKGADCAYGSDKIQILPGYWRDIHVMQNDAVVVHKCAPGHEEHCLGGLYSNCEVGYVGPMCSKCDVEGTFKNGKYRPFLRDTCKACDKLSFSDLVSDFLAIGIPVIVLAYTTYALLSGKNNGDASNSKLSRCLYINVFIGYIQNLYILNSLGYISLPNSLNYLANIIANPSFPIFGYLTCNFQKYIPLDETYLKMITLYGLVFLSKALVFVLLLKLVSKSALKKTVIALIWFGFNEAPGFLDFMFRFFDCSSFSIHMECDNKDFTSLKTYVLGPLVVFIAVTLPIAVTYSLTRGSMRSDENEQHKKLKIMLLARSSEHIDKSNRNWLSFFWVAFGRFGLLSLSLCESLSFMNLAVVGFYFATVFLFNMGRKVAFLDGWRSKILVLDVLVAVINLSFGYVDSLFDVKDVTSMVSHAYLIFNIFYILVAFVGSWCSGDNASYGKLDDETGEIEQEQEEDEEDESGNKKDSEDTDE